MNKTKAVEFKDMAAQGDLVFRRVKVVPKDFKPVPEKGRVIVGHSETGHHHAIDGDGVVRFENPSNPLICYLHLETVERADVVHHRPFDAHASLRLMGLGSIFEVRRQREYVPEGWRKVQD